MSSLVRMKKKSLRSVALIPAQARSATVWFSYWNGLSASYVPKYVRKQPRCTSMVGLYFILKIQSSTKDYISKHSVSDMVTTQTSQN
ncbi:hypothetical protein Plhal304r1_c021g0073751 [Plasmopara halstedii]